MFSKTQSEVIQDIIYGALLRCKTPEQRRVISFLHGEIARQWDKGNIPLEESNIMSRSFEKQNFLLKMAKEEEVTLIPHKSLLYQKPSIGWARRNIRLYGYVAIYNEDNIMIPLSHEDFLNRIVAVNEKVELAGGKPLEEDDLLEELF